MWGCIFLKRTGHDLKVIFMKNFLKYIFIIFTLFTHGNSYTSEGDEFLTPRQNGMANTGYSLSDDENVLYYNPAGLGISTSNSNYFSMLYSGVINYGEKAIINAIHKRFASLIKTQNIGGFALDAAYYDFKEESGGGGKLSDINNIDPDFIDMLNSLEGGSKNDRYFISLGWGYMPKAPKLKGHSFGTCINALFLPNDIDICTIDFGYIYETPFKLRAGLALKNLLQFRNYKFRNSRVNTLPRSIHIAAGYLNSVPLHKAIDVLGVAFELNGNVIFKKELYYYNYIDVSELIPAVKIKTEVRTKVYGKLNIGSELTLFNSLSLRGGYNLYDSEYKHLESHYGFGFRLFNHVKFDLYRFEDNDSFITDHFQFTLSIIDLLHWDRRDLKWWLRKE